MYEKVFNEEELKSSIERYNKIKHNKAEKERKKEKEKKELKRLCKKYRLPENTMLAVIQNNEYTYDLKRLCVLYRLCEAIKSEMKCPLIVQKSKFLTKLFYNILVKREVIAFYKKIKKLSKNGISFSAKNKNNCTYGILSILEEINSYSKEYVSLAIHLYISGFFEKYSYDDICVFFYTGEFEFIIDDNSYLESLITAYKATKKYYIKGE